MILLLRFPVSAPFPRLLLSLHLLFRSLQALPLRLPPALFCLPPTLLSRPLPMLLFRSLLTLPPRLQRLAPLRLLLPLSFRPLPSPLRFLQRSSQIQSPR